MPLDNDSELDAAFGGAAPPPIDDSALSRDPEINAAFGADVTDTAPLGKPPVYDPNRHAIGDEFVNQVHGAASGLYHTITGGYKRTTQAPPTRVPRHSAPIC